MAETSSTPAPQEPRVVLAHILEPDDVSPAEPIARLGSPPIPVGLLVGLPLW
jgi:hypothetical protein